MKKLLGFSKENKWEVVAFITALLMFLLVIFACYLSYSVNVFIAIVLCTVLMIAHKLAILSKVKSS